MKLLENDLEFTLYVVTAINRVMPAGILLTHFFRLAGGNRSGYSLLKILLQSYMKD